ncbi:hypothetical protein BN1221_00291 [Brenneria goodwinii]|uniref:Uncharacterized protein n=1 Tax=Brenneria goodwinii TaxID=1109412 RepID=A0A0G4JPM7_9GAMM|nr:hypothetical protein BN1221_00291 [Brenneria goodwinii]
MRPINRHQTFAYKLCAKVKRLYPNSLESGNEKNQIAE